MPIVERTVIVHGPIDDVFDLSQSYALRLDWDPFVRSQRPLGGAEHAAKGVLTETISRHRLRMVTEYLTFRPPTLVGMKMVEGPRIFRTFSGSWRFMERDDGRVDVAFRYNFACTPRWLAPIMERVGSWYLGRDIEKRVEAFRTACDHTDLLDRVRQRRVAAEPPTIPESSAEHEPEPEAGLPPIVDVAWLLDRRSSDPTLVLCHVGSTMAGPDPEQGYITRHLPDARFVSLDDVLAAAASGTAGRHPLPAPNDFAASLAALGIGVDATVVAYDERGGAFAGRLVWMLRVIGQRAALLGGGITAWEAAGEDVGIELVTWEPTERSVVDWPIDALADAIDVERHIAAGGVVIDSRDPARYAGELEPIDSAAGHVPGAVNLLFTDNLDSDGRFLSADELAARFSPMVGNDTRPIVYCGSGVTACHNALAMEHAGFELPRVYVGSWSGWIADADHPIATGPTP